MPPDYGPRPHYNIKFATAVIKAYVTGKTSFRFRKKLYLTEAFINNVREDLKGKFYKIQVTY